MAKIKFDFKKMDFTKVKKFLLAKGEKVALATVAGIGALLVFLGLWGAVSADGKQKTQDVRANTGKIRALMTADTAADIKKVDIKTSWSSHFFNFPFLQMVLISDGLPPKRGRPEINPVLVSDDNLQFDFWSSAPIQIYSINPDAQKAETVSVKGGGKELAETIDPRSMLVVTAFFPMAEQIQEFRKALRIAKEDDLGKDYPQILGIRVRRIELVKKLNPETNEMEWAEVPGKDIDLYKVDKDTTVAADYLKDLLRRVHIDDDALARFENHRMPNLMTLMPRLASSDYKPLTLKNFKAVDAGLKKGEKTKEGKKINQKGFDAPVSANKKPIREGKPGPETGFDELAAVDPNPGDGQFQKGGNGTDAVRLNALIARFRGTFPLFDGQEAGKAEANKGFDVKQPGPGKQGEKGKVPFKGESGHDPLIRFFDVDLEAGHTYAYQIAVRIRNPNWNMHKEVTRPEDADDPELSLNWAVTKPFTVPDRSGDVQVYAVDRWEKKPPHPLGPDSAVLDGKTNRATVQIHSWFDEGRYDVDTFIIVDWVVAERVLVRRGEFIGRKGLMVLAPSWSKVKGDFEIINPPKSAAVEEQGKEPEKGGGKILGEQPREKENKDKGKDKDKEKPFQAPPPSGINLDFTANRALLVDFEGGTKALPGKTPFYTGNLEESAMDLLILNPDGKMVVRNTHRDYANPARIEREREYHERLKTFMSAPTDQPDNNKKKGPARDKILN